ncbi:lysosomal phospholipase A and acyltransferase isoform X2 [Callorhinus ursinus]|uniref:Group XV phospholipase A2 isoform X2 n=1 Tax=Callorhinus ursinus TaxID=34884 RepID=A0A3Q7QRT7_CALUR|nr:group XV phospholipase A2 isoform X2 [Callorhinus ursinus]
MGLRLCPYHAALLPGGFLCLLLLADPALPVGRPPPVVLVPGDLGNQLEAKLDKPTVVHYLCSKRTDSYFTLWLNLELLLPVIIDCWIDNIRLVYNRTSRATQFPDGVDVRVPGFGKTFSLEFLDPSKSSVGSYFHTMVESLVSWGYTRGEDVRGAPYDWRRAPTTATGLEEQVYPCVCGTGCALGGRGQDFACPGLRRQQSDPGHRAPEDPGAAAVCRLHQLAAALQLHLVAWQDLRAHTHNQLHAAGLSPLLPGHRLQRRVAHAAGHGGAGRSHGATWRATALPLRHRCPHARLLLLRELPRPRAQNLLWRR